MFKFYGLPFVISFLLSILFCCILIFLFRKKKYNSRRGRRHIHGNKKISRLGGVAVSLAFGISLFLNQNIVFDQKTLFMLIGSFLILIFEFIDDFYELNWKYQLFFQGVIVCLIFYLGIKIEFITNPLGGLIFFNIFFSFLFTFVWVLIIINAINWSDGVDGLMGGIIFFTSVALFLLSLRPDVNQPPLAIISIILAGSVLGFLVFNFPPARIFAGSGGSFFMGYLVTVLAIFAGAKIGTTLLVLIIPLTDALFVVWQRWKDGQSFFQADTRHLHHRLIQLGWSHKKIAIFYYFITLIGVIIALSTNSIGKLFAFISFFSAILVFCFVLNKKVRCKLKD